MDQLTLSALCIQQRWRFISYRKYKRRVRSAVHIQRGFLIDCNRLRGKPKHSTVFRAWCFQRHQVKQLDAVLIIQRHWRAWKLKKHEEFKQLSSDTDGSSLWAPLTVHWSSDRGIASRHAIYTVCTISLLCMLSTDQTTLCRCGTPHSQ